jgi:hypothetical protein
LVSALNSALKVRVLDRAGAEALLEIGKWVFARSIFA